MGGEWVGRQVAVIDTVGYGYRGAVASYVVKGYEGVALVDVGYSTTAGNVVKSLRELGVEFDKVRYIFLTHFHLDHAGGSHKLLQHLPNATLVVHEGAIRHLIDPSRLVDAAVAAFGEDMAQHIGTLEPLQPERIEPAAETVYELGGVSLEVLATPGHVPSHISLYLEAENAVFTGDAVNVRHPALPMPLPAASPPIYDIDAAIQSLERLKSLKPKTLYTPHYGVRGVNGGYFDEEAEAIEWWRNEVGRMLNEGLRAEQIAGNMRQTLLVKAGLKTSELDEYVSNILLGRLLRISVLGYMGRLMRGR